MVLRRNLFVSRRTVEFSTHLRVLFDQVEQWRLTAEATWGNGGCPGVSIAGGFYGDLNNDNRCVLRRGVLTLEQRIGSLDIGHIITFPLQEPRNRVWWMARYDTMVLYKT